MIYQSSITMAPTDGGPTELALTWVPKHPGDEVERMILQLLGDNQSSTNKFVQIYNHSLIWLNWREFNGIALVLSPFEDLRNLENTLYSWSQHLIISLQNETWNKLEFQEDQPDIDLSNLSKFVNREWIIRSLIGGDIVLALDDPEFGEKFSSLIYYLPWILFLANSVNIIENQFIFHVQSSDMDLEYLPGIIFDRIRTGNMEFRKLLYHQLLTLKNAGSLISFSTMIEYIRLITIITSKDLEVRDKISLVIDHSKILIDLDKQYIIPFLKDLLSDISNVPPSPELCFSLLNMSQILLDLKVIDFAKLAEGTALENSLKINKDDRKAIILELTKRSKNWGENHIVAFMQSLNDLLSNSRENTQILIDAQDVIADELKKSWEGYICLVESNIIAEQYEKAVLHRLEASTHIIDRAMRAEDILNGLKWILHISLPSELIFDIGKSYISFAIENDENPVNLIDVLVQTSIQHSKEDLIKYLLSLIRENKDRFNLNYKKLMSKLTPHLHSVSSLLEAQMELKLLALQHDIEENGGPSDESFKIISKIFNTINPNDPNAKTLLVSITRKILEIAISFQSWHIIDETSRRFILMQEDQRVAKDLLFEIYILLASRWENYHGELSENDIHIRLFNEAIELAKQPDQFASLLDIIPKIKDLAVKTRSYNFLTSLIILQIKLSHERNNVWADQMAKDIKFLISKGKSVDVNLIFSEIFLLELTDEERYHVLKTQLELAEVEPDILTANELYEKRMQIMDLATDDIDHEFFLKNYSEGISELISKGNTIHLNDLVIDALKYCFEHNLDASEFSEILLDIFSSFEFEYQKLPSHNPSYYKLIKIWRQINQTFARHMQLEIITIGCRVISTNVNIYKKNEKNYFVIRALLNFKELMHVITDFNIELDYDHVPILFDTTEDLIKIMETKHPDFGRIDIISDLGGYLIRLKLENLLFSIIDKAIDYSKRSINHDLESLSSIFALFYGIANLVKDIDVSPILMEEFNKRVARIINLVYSNTTQENIKTIFSNLSSIISSNPNEIYRIYLSTFGDYFEHLK